jgi:hypothetical protein
MIVEIGLVEVVSGIIVLLTGALGVSEMRIKKVREDVNEKIEHVKELQEVKLNSLKEDLVQVTSLINNVLDKITKG